MKSLLVLVMISIFMLAVTTRKLSSRRHKHKAEGYNCKNSQMNFVLHALMSILEMEDSKRFEACIEGSKPSDTAEPYTESEKKNIETIEQKEVAPLRIIAGITSNLLSFVCNYKDKLEEFINALWKDSARRYRRRNRRFFQGKATYFKICFDCWMKEKYNQYVKPVIDKAIRIGSLTINSIGSAFSAGLDKVLQALTWAGSKLHEFYIKKIVPIVENVKRVKNCVNISDNLKKAVDSLIINVAAVVGEDTLLKVLKNIICITSDITKIIKGIIEASSEVVPHIKWGKWGSVLGIFIKTASKGVIG